MLHEKVVKFYVHKYPVSTGLHGHICSQRKPIEGSTVIVKDDNLPRNNCSKKLQPIIAWEKFDQQKYNCQLFCTH